jgi:hypothetical protein
MECPPCYDTLMATLGRGLLHRSLLTLVGVPRSPCWAGTGRLAGVVLQTQSLGSGGWPGRAISGSFRKAKRP